MKWLFALCLLLTPVLVDAGTKQIRIGVLDTGLDITDPRFKDRICGSYDATGTGIEDHLGHGTHVVGLIQKYAGNKPYCLVIIKYTDSYDDSGYVTFNRALYALRDAHVDVVNFSGGGDQYSSVELAILKEMNVPTFVAAGNHGKDIDYDKYYPASYGLKNVTPVCSLDSMGMRASTSNYEENCQWEFGMAVLSTLPYKIAPSGIGYLSGTSMATAIATGKFIYARLK